MDHRPDRRDEELRPRRSDLGDTDRARTRRRARRRGRVCTRARNAVVGGPRCGCVPQRRSDPRVVGRVDRGRARRLCVRQPGVATRTIPSVSGLFALSRRAGGRAASVTSGSTCSSPKARSTSPSTRSCRSGTSPRSSRSCEEAGGRWSTVDGRVDAAGGSFVCTNGVLHDTVTSCSRRIDRPAASSVAAMSEVTVGIDIGTSSVKAVAADADGNVVARARIPHDFHVPSPLRFEHDAAEAWHDGPRARARGARRRAAARRLGRGDGAVAHRGRRRPAFRCAPGLLYGDERGHHGERRRSREVGELAQFLRWHAAQPA